MVRVVRLERTVSWSQTRRDTNFAIPGYSLFCHDTTANGKNKVFSVCGHSCGQNRFCAVFCNRGKSRKCRCHKALRCFTLPRPGYRHGTPKCGTLPTGLHPDIQFLSLYHGGGENQRISCPWSFLWSKPLLFCFRKSGKVPQTQVSQGFAAFLSAPSRIPPRHSQSNRAAPGGAFRQGSCAAPGGAFCQGSYAAPGQVLFYYTITREKCKWEWRGKCGRLGTSESIGSGAQ